MKVLCTQIGSRQHYEVPLKLSLAGQLALLVTDFWNPLGRRAGWTRLLGSGILRRAAERFHPGIPSSKVRVPLRAHIRALVLASGRRPAGESLARLSVTLARQSARWSDRCDHDTLFAFCGASLEVAEREKALGNRVIVDQFDTGRELAHTLREESDRYKDLGASYPHYPDWYYDRLDEEWKLADQILVNSEWTRQCLTARGVPAGKIILIPLSLTAVQPVFKPKRMSGGRLRVLWLGRMCLGKGLMYAVEAARAVSGLPIEFTFAGIPAVDVTRIDWPRNCRVIGQVPRSAVPGLYRSHEVFLFPTLSDGFGRVQIEAALHGLPIIATERCGSVVEHNRSGYVVPVRDSQAIAECLAGLLCRPHLLEEMSMAAMAGVIRFSEDRIWPQLERALAGTVEARVSDGVACG
jgi:glycosyltransferase involved in cell wall biosynthesis